MALDMKVSGKMTSNMGRVRKPGQMVPYMRDNTSPERSMATAFTAGTMALAMRESGMRTKFEAWVLIPGLTEESTKENG